MIVRFLKLFTYGSVFQLIFLDLEDVDRFKECVIMQDTG